MSANCLKPRILLAQLGLEYERVERRHLRPRPRKAELARNPTKLVPVLETDDGAFIPESGAIMLFLAEGTPFLPPPGVDRARVHQWLFFEQNQLEPGPRGGAVHGSGWGSPITRPRCTRTASTRGAAHSTRSPPAWRTGGRSSRATTYSVADIQVYAYAHTAGEVDLRAAARGRGLGRVAWRRRPGS